jgi:hypothetical protein
VVIAYHNPEHIGALQLPGERFVVFVRKQIVHVAILVSREGGPP